MGYTATDKYLVIWWILCQFFLTLAVTWWCFVSIFVCCFDGRKSQWCQEIKIHLACEHMWCTTNTYDNEQDHTRCDCRLISRGLRPNCTEWDSVIWVSMIMVSIVQILPNNKVNGGGGGQSTHVILAKYHMNQKVIHCNY